MLLTMSPSGLRARNRARTRDDIIEAALGLFEGRGYDATTCEDIAAAADVSVRTFFRYFDAKVDVLVAGRSDEEGPQAVIAEVLDRPAGEQPVAVLRRALRHPIGVLESQRDLVVRQVGVMMATPSLETLRREQFHRFEDPLAAAIATRLGRPPDDLDARLLAAATAAALRISIERWVASGARRGNLRPLLDEAFDRLEHGLRTPKRSASRLP
jgi:AcrR family transcriptional regulator